MSITFRPKNKAKVAKTAWSYADGGLDANVDGQHWLADVHKAIGLPIVEKWGSVPWSAKAAECRAWAKRLTEVFTAMRLKEPAAHTGDDAIAPAYLVAWRDFLATCGGYSVDT